MYSIFPKKVMTDNLVFLGSRDWLPYQPTYLLILEQSHSTISWWSVDRRRTWYRCVLLLSKFQVSLHAEIRCLEWSGQNKTTVLSNRYVELEHIVLSLSQDPTQTSLYYPTYWQNSLHHEWFYKAQIHWMNPL